MGNKSRATYYKKNRKRLQQKKNWKLFFQKQNQKEKQK